jgi:ubiquinone/menaquinone biosynthesis C-methylase UbiE
VYDFLSYRSEAPMRAAGLDLLKAAPGENVLEIGFGTGHCLSALARSVGPTGTVFGIDLSDRMMKLARRNLARAGLLDRCALCCCDAARLPCRQGSLHAVFMSFTLELFDTPEIPEVLSECQRVLRPGGRIVVVGMSKEGPAGPMVRYFEWMHRQFPRLLDCRPIYVRRMLEDSGFAIEKQAIRHMWIPVEIVLGIRAEP